MKIDVKGFWEKRKNVIKNIVIAVAVPLAAIALIGIHGLNKTIKENDMEELFYGDDEKSKEDSEVTALVEQNDVAPTDEA